MAYKQPKVPAMKDGAQIEAYMRELILFLKDFSLETWMAVRAQQGKLKAHEEAEKEAKEETKRAAVDAALPVGIIIRLAGDGDPNALYSWQTWTQAVDGGAGNAWQRTA